MKKIVLLVSACLLCSITGCSGDKKPDPDHMMLCSFTQEDEEGLQNHSALFTYVEETGEAVTSDIKTNYEGFEKNETNNKVLTDMTVRKSILEDIEGVTMEVFRTDTSFGSEETWEYRKIDTAVIVTTDELQKHMVDEKQAMFSIDEIRDYYEAQHYACSISDMND